MTEKIISTEGRLASPGHQAQWLLCHGPTCDPGAPPEVFCRCLLSRHAITSCTISPLRSSCLVSERSVSVVGAW